jgi:hypothetical protein
MIGLKLRSSFLEKTMSSTNPVFVSQIDGVSCPTGQQEFPLVAPETGTIIGAIREAGK